LELHSYLSMLRKHLILICVVVVVCTGAALALFWRTDPTYASQVQFYVSTPLPEGNNAQSAGQFAQARVNSYVELLSSEVLASRVIQSSGVDLGPRQVAGRITANADVNTVLVTATVTDEDRERSLAIAKGVGTEFPKMVDELDNAGRDDALVVIHIVSGPTLLPGQVAPNLRLYLLIGIAAGLVLGIGYAVLKELLDVSIRTTSEANESAGTPILGSLPFDPDMKHSPLIIGPHATSPRAEAHRKLRTNLQFVDAAKSASSILITSSLPGEGKSITAVNLALSLVELGERVLLIDADMRKPQASRYLDLASDVGLSNVLAGQAELDHVVQPWGDQGLSVLASGSVPPNPAELLGSTRMRELLEELSGRFDRVIVDSPPILPVTDAVVIAREVSCVVLVIRAHKTARSDVSHAANALRAVGAPLVGAVLNMRKVARSDHEYHGNYRYSAKPAGNPLVARILRRTSEDYEVE
jgi:capsular exopolysaccharide synthesis family protein